MIDPVARITIRPKYVLVTVTSLLLAVGTPPLVWVFLRQFLPVEWLLGITLLAVLFDIVLSRALSSCYRSFELDGDTIRGWKLLTRRLNEWQVRNIVNVRGIGLKELGLREVPVTENDARWRLGYEIEFKDGQKLLLSRHEMIGLEVFLVELADQIKR